MNRFTYTFTRIVSHSENVKHLEKNKGSLFKRNLSFAVNNRDLDSNQILQRSCLGWTLSLAKDRTLLMQWSFALSNLHVKTQIPFPSTSIRATPVSTSQMRAQITLEGGWVGVPKPLMREDHAHRYPPSLQLQANS